jgi:citrate lyase subunit beta/citryl-CoA lyase
VLYVPGSNTRAIEKCRSLPVDGIIFDLEDAVAPSAKVQARTNALQAISSGGYGGREIFLRVNGMDTPWGKDDLQAAANSGANAVLLPKVDCAANVKTADEVLRTSANQSYPAIWCMIETARAVLNALEIAEASEKVGGLVMGTTDLAAELHATADASRMALATPLGLCLLAARAARKPILDGVFLDLCDDVGFHASCVHGRAMGFDGKTLIHPKTVDVANRVFAPSDAEILHARKVIAAFEKALQEGSGVAVVDGRLVEQMHVEEALRVVRLSEAILAAHTKTMR